MTLAAALAGAIIISFSAIFFGLSGADPVTASFYRAAYALPVLAMLWWARRHQDRRTVEKRWIAVGAGVALGLDTIVWHTAITYVGAGLATLIANIQVVIIAIVGWLVLGERPTRTVLRAIPVILIGVALVSGIGQSDAFGADPVRGTLLALLAAVLYSSFMLLLRASNDVKAPAAGPLTEATIGALAATLVVGGLGSGIEFGFEWPQHGWLLALGLGAQVIAWLLISYALPRLPAVETATIILIQPALTMAWGALIFDERPSLIQIIGAVVVLAGVASVALARARSDLAGASSPGQGDHEETPGGPIDDGDTDDGEPGLGDYLRPVG